MKRRSKEDPGIVEEAVESSPLARLLVNCLFAESLYLPYFIANSLPEKVAVERHVNSLLNLDRARAEGLISNYTLVWKKTTAKGYPAVPSHIRLYAPKGKEMADLVPRPLLKEISRIRASR